jgi:hypothetical protein
MNLPGIEAYLPASYPVAWILALLLGVFWLTLVTRTGWWRQFAVWPALILGAAVFAPSIAWVQSPLQYTTGDLLVKALGAASLRANLLLAGIPQVLESGLVQEAAKLLVIVVLLLALRLRGGRLVLVGAAVGAAFGAFEAAWTFGLMFASGWTTDTFQLLGPMAFVGFVERFFAVAFHAASGTILGYGLQRGRAGWYYGLAALLHGLVNYVAILMQVRAVDAVGSEVWVGVTSLLTFALAFALAGRSRLTLRATA